MSTRTALICDWCGWIVYMPHAASPRASVLYKGWSRRGDHLDACPTCNTNPYEEKGGSGART